MENISPLETPELKAIIEKFSPFLSEVKKRVILTLGVFTITTIFGFAFSERIIKALISIMGLEGVNIVFTSPFQYITLSFSSAFAVGLIFTLPLIIFQILSFLKPALKRKEFKTITRFLPYSIILFLLGFTFGIFAMKWQLQIFLDKSVRIGIGNVLDISKYLSTVLLTSTFMGLSFQFPIILLIFMRLGVVKHHQLAAQRKWIYLGSFIFAILLPVDSILIDVILALPLVILFEVTLVIAKLSTPSNSTQLKD